MTPKKQFVRVVIINIKGEKKMAKGDVAKSKIASKLEKLFGENYIGEYSKKYYVWEDDGGERVQIAITLTHPKVPVASITQVDKDGGISFDVPTNAAVAPTGFAPAEITQEEQDNLATLLKKFNL